MDKAIHVSLYKHDEMLATYTVHARLFILCNTLNCLGFFKQMYFWSQKNVKFHHRNLARGGFDRVKDGGMLSSERTITVQRSWWETLKIKLH